MLLDRLKRKIQRLTTPKRAWFPAKAKKREITKEERVEKILKKKEESTKPIKPVVAEEAKDDIKKRKTGVAPLVLRSPQITEKAVALEKQNQYVFKVADKAVKSEVKKAIEEVYNVDVLKIRMIYAPAKKKRLGRTMGWQKGYKKAIVTIKKGQSIEILPR